MLSVLLASCSLGQKAVARIDVGDTLPRQFEYGSTPDFSSVMATIVYNDSTTKQVSAGDLQFGTIDTSKVGKQNLTVTYDGFTQNFEVEVVRDSTRRITSIEYVSGISSSVFTGDTIVYGTIVLKANFSDNTEETITLSSNNNVTYNTIDTSNAGKQTITFTYMGKSCQVEVNVQAIKVTKIPILH